MYNVLRLYIYVTIIKTDSRFVYNFFDFIIYRFDWIIMSVTYVLITWVLKVILHYYDGYLKTSKNRPGRKLRFFTEQELIVCFY